MSCGNWVLCVALGLALWVSTAASQEFSEAPLEGQPITDSRQEQSAANSDGGGNGQPQTTIDPTLALQGIESAIRDLIAEEDEIERRGQEQRDIRDLKAQEEMAIWAKRMTWATVGGLLLTFAGLILIGYTLHHTKRAADYAGDMAVQAAATTQAALDAAKAAKDANAIMREDQRAWLKVSFDGGGLLIPRERKLFWLTQIGVENLGQKPATNVKISKVRIIGHPNIQSLKDELAALIESTVKVPHPDEEIVIFPGRTVMQFSIEQDADRCGQYGQWVFGAVLYRTNGLNYWCCTPFIFQHTINVQTDGSPILGARGPDIYSIPPT